MRLNSLRLQNFRQHLDTYVTFDTGLTGIIGANGSGKSTLLEAIAWALYGQDAARGKKETLRSLRAGPNARLKVELDFELGGHRYRVERGLTTAELYLDGSDAPIANSLTGVTELLRRRLGMSRDEFFNTYFTGQKELDVMAAMAPSERAQFLSRVLGYERLRVAQRLTKDQARLLGAEATGLRTALPDAASVERSHAEAATRLAQAPALAEEATLELEQQRAILELMEGELEAKRTEWVRDKQEAETKRAALREQYAEIKDARERLVAAGEDGTCPTCERPLHDHYRSV